MSIAYLKRYSNGKNFSFLKRGAVCSYLGLEERMRTKRFWSLIKILIDLMQTWITYLLIIPYRVLNWRRGFSVSVSGVYRVVE